MVCLTLTKHIAIMPANRRHVVCAGRWVQFKNRKSRENGKSNFDNRSFTFTAYTLPLTPPHAPPLGPLEIHEIVQDYFEMFAMEARQIPFRKSEHRKRLKPKLHNRSDGSIEFRHQNIVKSH